MSAVLSLLPTATKVCTKCRIEKQPNQFAKQKNGKDGHASRCRQCTNAYSQAHYFANREKRNKQQKTYWGTHREELKELKKKYHYENREWLNNNTRTHCLTPDGFTTKLWSALNARTINGTHPNWNSKCRCYLLAGVELRLTRQQLLGFIIENQKIIQAIRAAGGKPSIHRIGPSIHYELGNIQIISLSEHCRLSACETNTKKRAKKAAALKREHYEE